ncbi:MAG TPA: hypothetical protein PLM53_19730 [Spirochaetota bacterium]|nr:hypothetical protein [Spirochaetota bacterium]HPC43203.1 hypothetical protein [Spirochaetota bacterium]HPL19055.1 hypothetical protein [Spirochaetota bacterium]HQF10426.1 hypothetical protein [Spirochaetota bacterium]HQH99325.1 hypothetical protein [Spirochaetota bacterium]
MLPVPWILFRRMAPAEAAKNRKAFGRLDDDQRRVHHFVVRELPGMAGPMGPDFVAGALGMDSARVASIMDELERRKLFLYRPGGRDVEWAYPVTVVPTPHRVEFSSGEAIWAA